MEALEAFEKLSSCQEVKDLYKGDCKGCGECCSRFIPVSGFDLSRLRSYVEENGVELEPERGDIDLLCPFLGSDRECKVYPARPEICRVYRCDEHKAGKLRVPFMAWAMETTDMREEFSK